MEEISVEVKKAIINQELSMWLNTRYQFEVRHRINKKIGSGAEILKNIEDELTKCEKMIDALEDELNKLENE